MFGLNDTSTGKNSCLIKALGQILTKADSFVTPEYYLEDYFIDYFDVNDISYEIKNHKLIISNKNITYDTLWTLKYKAYSAVNWYPECKEYTFNSTLIPLDPLDYTKTLEHINIIWPKFIKLDNVSAKDVHDTNIFKDKNEWITTFQKSERIQNSLNKASHLFVRDVYTNLENNIECRCFVYHGKLTAISIGYESKTNQADMSTNISKFFENIILPYNDVTVDLLYPDLKIIECNSFGPEMPCGSGNFNWSEDYSILHSDGSNVVIKCDDEFE
jgi:hypothetical protein